jgi:threonine dehydratase
MTPPLSYAEIEAASVRLRHQVNQTPVMTSRTVNDRTGCQVFFKCENFQRSGSFKFRGAFNALASLSEQERQRGVLTYSSGNHAQGVALAGKLLNIPTTIVMPHDAPAVKLAATRGYGAEVIPYDRSETTREALVKEIAQERDATIIPPYDYLPVIAGQGTTAKELFETVGELDLLLVCCGGGGLLSGCAIAANTLSPQCRVVGVEPENADDATRSFHSKTLQTVHNPDTIADGARTPSLGNYTFPLVLHYVHDMVTVSDDALLQTMFFLWERLKLIVEPTGALAATALLEGKVNPTPHSRVGVIISGGNVDLRRVLGVLPVEKGGGRGVRSEGGGVRSEE